MTTQDYTIISEEKQDLISLETPNSTSIINNNVDYQYIDQRTVGFLSFFTNFPGYYSPYSAIEAFFLAVVLVFITFLTIAGNATICFIIIYFKRFRRANYLVTSLAVSDLLVGLLVMPPAIIYQISGDWYFGSVPCHIWLSADVLNCTASIFNLCMVSIDRFWLIMKPLKYERKRTKLRMIMYIAIIWLLAIFISMPLLTMGNEYEEVENGPTLCALYQHFIYQLYAIVGSFYIPLLVIIPMNYKLFTAARDKSAMNYHESRFEMELEYESSDNRRITLCPRHSHNEEAASAQEIHLRNTTASTSSDSPTRHLTSEPHESLARNIIQKSIRMLAGRNSRVCTCTRRQQRRRRSERKASTTLGIIVGAFVFCWLPFFMLALIRPFYKSDDIPNSVSSLFLWLGYCNSALNPIIYAIFNQDIRKPFILIMCLRWRNLNELMREDYYHRQFGEQRTRHGMSGGNNGTHTERADLVDGSNQNIGHSNRDVDNNNQNVDNNNRNVNNRNVDHNNQNIDNNNHDVDSNNQDIGGNKQDVDSKNQDVDDDNQVVVDNNQIVIDIAEESNEISSL